ncbi:hypothetical protein BC830DRAFT_674650 [Chytriomyces sp. MP71]|nr:hypothetical protein BC830DRAFT_674650 [Chytriomyces sp. MP71]
MGNGEIRSALFTLLLASSAFQLARADFLCGCFCDKVSIGTVSSSDCGAGCILLANISSLCASTTNSNIMASLTSINYTYIIAGSACGLAAVLAACAGLVWYARRWKLSESQLPQYMRPPADDLEPLPAYESEFLTTGSEEDGPC